MATMKYPNVPGANNMAVSGNGSHMEDVDSVFASSCWQNSGPNLQNDFMDTNKLILEGSVNNLGSDKLLLEASVSDDDGETVGKPNIDDLNNLLLVGGSGSGAAGGTPGGPTHFAELKPLPPFAGYTANLSINGIQGHHYHAIAAHRIPEENNNTYGSFAEQNIVSSSTCNSNADSVADNDKSMFNVEDFPLKMNYIEGNPDSVSGTKVYDECAHQGADSVTHIKTEITEYDISSIDDIAAIIGSAIADTTVPNNGNQETDDATGSRDSWMDLDAWIEGACSDQQQHHQQKSLVITQDGLAEFVLPNTTNDYTKTHTQVEYTNKIQPTQNASTLQSLLTHGYVPILHSRLQNGPAIKQELPSSTNFGPDLISASSPPANVVSTTDNLMLTVNGRFLPQYAAVHGLGGQDDRIRSPDLLGQNYPHTTTTTPNAAKKSRNRAQKKQAASSTVFQSEQSLSLLGKEKPVHRCNICNRGFLNKSNIKVHLRTHTGEKPFRCETCAKAFRQKAHLLKHQQIHKRIGRD